MLKWLYKFSGKEYGSGEGLDYPKAKDGFLWIYGSAPTEKELAKLKRDFDLTGLKNYTKEKRSVKYSYNPLCFALVDYYLLNKKVKRLTLFYYVDKNTIITLAPEALPPYDETFTDIKAQLKSYPLANVYILYDILNDDVEENFEILEVLDDEIISLEKKVLDIKTASQAIERILLMKRELIDMTKVFWSNAKIMFWIRQGITPIKLDVESIKLLGSIHDTLVHQVDVVMSQKEMLTDALTIYETTLSNRLATISNKININIKTLTWVMLWLTGVTLVLTFPNTIATIFGIPEFPLDWNSWPFIVVILTVFTILPLIWFLKFWSGMKKQAEGDAKALVK